MIGSASIRFNPTGVIQGKKYCQVSCHKNGMPGNISNWVPAGPNEKLQRRLVNYFLNRFE
jgi:hypothetical protein